MSNFRGDHATFDKCNLSGVNLSNSEFSQSSFWESDLSVTARLCWYSTARNLRVAYKAVL
ncbi:pentapeptide repeat-containing protein [Chlorogloeopsis sp. ULAP02]|uniref:pentapeptide repeat-containing protein n=1 Tax=Chlorogloeopsis sp. ULAP02 TaxID=3107926 RepID=UPI0031361F3C